MPRLPSRLHFYNPCTGDPRRPSNPTLNTTFQGSPRYPVEDAFCATCLLAEPVNLTLTTGLWFQGPRFDINTTGQPPPRSMTFELPAGLHSVHVAALPGGQRAELSRGGGAAVSRQQLGGHQLWRASTRPRCRSSSATTRRFQVPFTFIKPVSDNLIMRRAVAESFGLASENIEGKVQLNSRYGMVRTNIASTEHRPHAHVSTVATTTA